MKKGKLHLGIVCPLMNYKYWKIFMLDSGISFYYDLKAILKEKFHTIAKAMTNPPSWLTRGHTLL